ncbi:Uncharacterised protein [Actinobacillus equuli]|nr:Uncharacterised protein [Actinobacillus equuli]
MKLSLVVPVFNEQEAIPLFMKQLLKMILSKNTN